MKLLADLHTHSKYSRFFHGKHTIEQMAITANELGLVEIAITDHGFNHWCGTNIVNLLKAREEIDEINAWSKTKVLLGIEADILDEEGTLDIDEDVISLIDVLVVGYHRLIKTNFAGYFGNQKKDKASIKKATNAFVNAIEKYPVTIVSHLDSILKTDLYQIGKACANKGVMVEINNRHCKWTEEQVNDLIASGCMFVLSSDAHNRDDIGVVNRAMQIVKKYNIPKELIANVELEADERDEDADEIDSYYGIYQAKQKAKEEREERLEQIKKTQFTNELSDEMERKLRQIAKEKGLHYDEAIEEDDLLDEYQKFRTSFSETEQLIKNAKEYLNGNTLNEFDTQNAKVEDTEFVKSSGESVELNDADKFNIFEQESKFNSANVDNSQENVENKAEPAENQIIQNEQSKSLNNEETENNEFFDVMQRKQNRVVKKQETETMSKQKLSRNGVEIVKNDNQKKTIQQNTVQTNANSNKNNNGRSLESFMQSLKQDVQEEQTKPESKESAKKVNKKGNGGVFIGVIDDENDKK